MGEKRQALTVLQQAAIFHAGDRRLASEYGRLALDLDQVSLAKQLLERADDPTQPDWRVVLARGTVLAKEGRYKDAIPYYERADAGARPARRAEQPCPRPRHERRGGEGRGLMRRAAAAGQPHGAPEPRARARPARQARGSRADASQDLTPEHAAANAEYTCAAWSSSKPGARRHPVAAVQPAALRPATLVAADAATADWATVVAAAEPQLAAAGATDDCGAVGSQRY